MHLQPMTPHTLAHHLNTHCSLPLYVLLVSRLNTQLRLIYETNLYVRKLGVIFVLSVWEICIFRTHPALPHAKEFFK